MGRSFWGSDISDKAMQIAKERLSALEIASPTGGGPSSVRFVDALPRALLEAAASPANTPPPDEQLALFSPDGGAEDAPHE
jgi:hypothetical protein